MHLRLIILGHLWAPLPSTLTLCFPLYNPGTSDNSEPLKTSKTEINPDASLLIRSAWVPFGFSYKSLWLESFFIPAARDKDICSCFQRLLPMLSNVFPVLGSSHAVFAHTRHWRRGSELHQARVSESSADTYFFYFFLHCIQPAWCHIGPW